MAWEVWIYVSEFKPFMEFLDQPNWGKRRDQVMLEFNKVKVFGHPVLQNTFPWICLVALGRPMVRTHPPINDKEDLDGFVGRRGQRLMVASSSAVWRCLSTCLFCMPSKKIKEHVMHDDGDARWMMGCDRRGVIGDVMRVAF